MTKEYLYVVKEEKDYSGDPITVLYLTPKRVFEEESIIPDDYDEDDEVVILEVLNDQGLEEASEWVFESYEVDCEEVEEVLSKVSYFHKSDAFQKFIGTENKK